MYWYCCTAARTVLLGRPFSECISSSAPHRRCTTLGSYLIDSSTKTHAIGVSHADCENEFRRKFIISQPRCLFNLHPFRTALLFLGIRATRIYLFILRRKLVENTWYCTIRKKKCDKKRFEATTSYVRVEHGRLRGKQKKKKKTCTRNTETTFRGITMDGILKIT